MSGTSHSPTFQFERTKCILFWYLFAGQCSTIANAFYSLWNALWCKKNNILPCKVILKPNMNPTLIQPRATTSTSRWLELWKHSVYYRSVVCPRHCVFSVWISHELSVLYGGWKFSLSTWSEYDCAHWGESAYSSQLAGFYRARDALQTIQLHKSLGFISTETFTPSNFQLARTLSVLVYSVSYSN